MTDGILHLSIHFFDRCFINEWTNAVGRVHAITCPHATYAGLQGLEERLENSPLNKNSVRADAGLTGVEEFHQRHALGGMHGVGVVIHDEGRMTTEFHRYPLKLWGAGLGQMLAHRGRAGKRQFPDRWVGAKHFADGFRIARGDQIGYPRRQASLFEDFEDGDGTERCALGGLQYYGASCC